MGDANLLNVTKFKTNRSSNTSALFRIFDVKMEETDDETSYRNSWGPDKDLMFVNSSISAMPKWNEERNGKKARALIRELLRKSSGGNILGMLSNVLTVQERQELIKDERISQEVKDSLDLKQDIASQSVEDVGGRSKSPSLLENYEKDL